MCCLLCHFLSSGKILKQVLLFTTNCRTSGTTVDFTDPFVQFGMSMLMHQPNRKVSPPLTSFSLTIVRDVSLAKSCKFAVNRHEQISSAKHCAYFVPCLSKIGPALKVRVPENIVFPNLAQQEDQDEQSDLDSNPPRRRFWGCGRKIAIILFSETALKFHLFIYWLFCLFGMIEEKPHSLQVIKVMLVAMAIIFALLATVTRAVCLFYPFLFVIVFEFSKHTAIFFLLALKLMYTEKYVAIINMKGFGRLHKLTKKTRGEDEIYYIWCGFCVVYFVLVALTLIRNIMDYQWKEHLRRRHRNVYQPQLVPPVQMQRLLIPREPEVGNTNIDDPPPYSSTIRAGSAVETAKEETDPPRYSQLELPLDNTRSSYSSPNENSREFETAPSRASKSLLSKH